MSQPPELPPFPPLSRNPTVEDNKYEAKESEPMDLNKLSELFVEAAKQGEAVKLEELLLQGVDVNYQESKGAYTALIKACRMQRIECVKTLLANGAQINKASHNGWTAFIEACRVGHQDLAEMLLTTKGLQMNFKNGMGWTALVEACRNGHLHIVKLLAKYGADMMSVDKDGLVPREHTANPAIHEVIDSAFKDSVIASGRNWDDVKAEMDAKKQAIANRLEDKLVNAALEGDEEEVKNLIKKGIDVNCTSTNGGYTPLIMACRGKKASVVKFLLAQPGIQVNKQSTTGWTAAIESARVGSIEIMHLLRNYKTEKVDWDLTQAFGWPPLIEACRNSHYNVAELLLEWDVDVTRPDRDGDVPVDHATHPWIIGLLNDRFRFGKGGPLARIKRAIRTTQSMNQSAKLQTILDAVREIDTAFCKTDDTETGDFVRWSVFTAILAEVDPELVRTVLGEPHYPEMLKRKNWALLQSVVEIPLQEHVYELEPLSRAEAAVKMFEVCMDMMHMGNLEDRLVFLNCQDPETHASIVHLLAVKYTKQMNAILTSTTDHGTEWRRDYYHRFLSTMIASGVDVKHRDAGQNSLLLELLKPLEKMRAESAHDDFVAEYISDFERIFWVYYHDGQNPKVPKSAMEGPLGASGPSPIKYLLCSNESAIPRKTLILEFLECGAVCPPDPVFADRLQTLVVAEMERLPEVNWRACCAIVRNGDTAFFRSIIAETPIFLTHPLGSRGVKQKLKRKHLTPESDTGPSQECLLFMAIDHLDMAMFDLLLEVGSRPSEPHPQNRNITWPWPDSARVLRDEGEAVNGMTVNLCIAWTNERGRSSIHHLASRRVRDSARAKADPAAMLTRLILMDITSMTQRPDRYGWTPAHYAAWTNQRPLIQVMASFQIDLGQATYDTSSHSLSRTPLHLGALAGNWSVVTTLLEAGVKAEVMDKDGCTPLALVLLERRRIEALEQGDDASLKLLETLPQNLSDLVPAELELLVHGVSGVMPEKLKMVIRASGNVVFGAGAMIGRMGLQGVKGLISGVKTVATGVANAAGKATSVITGNKAEEAAAPVAAPVAEVAEEENAVEMIERGDRDSERSQAGDRTRGVSVVLDAAPAEQLADAEGRAVVPRSVIAKAKETYDLCIRALLGHDASIENATKLSGKSLFDFIDVHKRWYDLCHEVAVLTMETKKKREQHYEWLAAQSGSDHADMELRAQRTEDVEREIEIIEKHKDDLFGSKETQSVIDCQYQIHIQRRQYMKLFRYVAFLICLTILGIFQSTQDNSNAYFMTNSLVNALPGTVSAGTDVTGFWTFMNGPFKDIIYGHSNPLVYTSMAPHNQTALDGVVMAHLYTIGAPRLRQVRSQLETCDLPSAERSSFVCHTEPTDSITRDPFGPAPEYTYKSKAEANSYGSWGRIWSYDGGGYVVQLPDPRVDTSIAAYDVIIQKLIGTDNTTGSGGWLDQATRAVFVEFVVFNANENQFLTASILFEFPRVGNVQVTWDFLVTKLERYNTTTDWNVEALQWVVLVMVILIFQSEFSQLATSGLSYFDSFWNLVDCAMMALAPCILALRIYEASIPTPDWTTDGYPKVMELARVQYVENYLYSLLILLGWFKLFDYLSVFERLYRLIIIIELMMRQLAYWSIIFLILVGGFVCADYVAYGYLDNQSYTLFIGYVARVIGVFTQHYLRLDHTKTQRILGNAFDLIYIIAVAMLMLNLIIALLTSAYEEASHASGDELAKRQFDKLEGEGYTKLKRAREGLNGQESKGSRMERMDLWVLAVSGMLIDRLSDAFDQLWASLMHGYYSARDMATSVTSMRLRKTSSAKRGSLRPQVQPTMEQRLVNATSHESVVSDPRIPGSPSVN